MLKKSIFGHLLSCPPLLISDKELLNRGAPYTKEAAASNLGVMLKQPFYLLSITLYFGFPTHESKYHIKVVGWVQQIRLWVLYR